MPKQADPISTVLSDSDSHSFLMQAFFLGMLLPIDLLHVQVLWTSLISVLSFGLA